MLRFVVLFFCVNFMFLLPSTQASTTFIVCDTCGSDYRAYENAVKRSSDWSSDTVYVMNFTVGALKKFDVLSSPPEPGFPGDKLVTEISVTSVEKQSFNEVIAERNKITSFFDANQVIPADVVGSAYDLVIRMIFRN